MSTPMYPIRNWINRHLSNPQVVGLTVMLLVGAAVVTFLGGMLVPVFASIVLAYLLEGIVRAMTRYGVRRGIAVLIVYLLFILCLVATLTALLPTILNQVIQLVENLPAMLERGQQALLQLPERYPAYFSTEQVAALLDAIRREAIVYARSLASSFSLASVVMAVTVMVYAVLLPVLIFFFLWDKARILGWAVRFLPRHYGLVDSVWREVDLQIGNYVRGKFVEVAIVWIGSFLTFAFLGLDFAMLLALMVGLSVIIPYVGAIVVTLPIAIVAYFQFGATNEFMWVLIAYAIIQAIDANVLVPLLFSEAVNLHPVAIIIAILIFGGIWGFWGVFFAIPLANLIQAVINAWPRPDMDEEAAEDAAEDDVRPA
ncbi:putative permease [Spiribacter vilamensis]|uniref:Putative permease n=2 Tax=Spiribacter vilamensis TaxID=531306 RepID=A0A4Q8D161_9GAMM|nr:putative permease [Spiribacter vilamensis]